MKLPDFLVRAPKAAPADEACPNCKASPVRRVVANMRGDECCGKCGHPMPAEGAS